MRVRVFRKKFFLATVVFFTLLVLAQTGNSSGLEDEKRDKYNEIDKEYFKTNINQLISIKSEKDIFKKRDELIQYIWGDKGFPFSKMPSSIKNNIADNNYREWDCLKKIDRFVILMDYGINSIIYCFHPLKGNNKAVIYVQGHNMEGFVLAKNAIESLLKEGYTVFAFSMPLLGMNSKPTVYIERVGRLKLEIHDHLKFLDRPIRFFLEPVAIIVNYVDSKLGYKDIYMTGISGGGWTTTLYSAIDPRISKSYPVAGSYPIFLRSGFQSDWGDYEQTVPELYRIATYLELYMLGSYGEGRRQLQILNQYDAACFAGIRYRVYEGKIRSLLTQLGKGRFDVYLDSSHSEHKISKEALCVMINDMGN